MLADTIQSFGNQCWIESSPFLTSTHLHVIPGPLNLESKQPQTLSRDVVVTITPMTDVHRADLFVAASDTASDMATEAVEHLEQVHLHQNLYHNTLERKNHGQTCNTLPNSFQSFNPSHAQKEMNIAFHYNAVSYFSQFTNLYCANHSALIDEDRDLPPLSDASLDPFSQEYQDMDIDAVHLHDSCNLSTAQKIELESLIRQYPHVFMLSGAPFRIVGKMSDADTYRSKHVETSKLLDPTNIDKLVKVEPW